MADDDDDDEGKGDDDDFEYEKICIAETLQAEKSSLSYLGHVRLQCGTRNYNYNYKTALKPSRNAAKFQWNWRRNSIQSSSFIKLPRVA